VSKQVTRVIAVENLKRYVGLDLYDLAIQNGITVFKEGKINKGWKGQALEILAGLENNSRKAPNGLGFELKSVSFRSKNDEYVPKETMAITMINQKELLQDSFYESHCWEKLKTLVFCAVEWNGTFAKSAKLLEVTSLDFFEGHDIIKEIEADYEFIREKLRTQGFAALTGKDGKWIQARTKGPGHGSTSRALYARTQLVAEIFNRSRGIKTDFEAT
jgi:DNA mismatch repair protein MutH